MGQDRDSVKKNIIQATILCIERDGIQSLTTRSVAKEAGVNSAAINYYFGSKDRLLSETLKQTIDHFFFDLYDIIGSTKLSAYSLLQIILTFFLKGMIRYPNLLKSFFFDSFFNPEKEDAVFTQRFNEFLNSLVEMISVDSRRIESFHEEEDISHLKMNLMQMISAVLTPGFSWYFFRDVSQIDLRDPKRQTEYINQLLRHYINWVDKKTIEREKEDVERILQKVFLTRM